MRPDQLKRIRKDLGYSQAKIAEILGLSENSIGLYERQKVTAPKYVTGLCFGLWLEKVAEIVPTIEACLSADESQIDTVFGLFDAKKELKKPKSMYTIIDQLGG